MENSKFKFVIQENFPASRYEAITITTYWGDFVRRYFKSKINIFFIIIFILTILLLIFGRLLSPYSAISPINKNDASLYIGNLPASYNEHRTMIISSDLFFDELSKLNAMNPKINLTFSTILGDQKSVNFNYAEFLKTANNIEFIKPILGTNYLGTDIWNETLISGFNSLIIALPIAFLEMILGLIIGSYLGYYNNKNWAIFLAKVVDMINAVPTIIWFTILVIALPNNFIFLYISFLLVGWASPSYWARFYILKVKEESYVLASKSLGSSNSRIIILEALPQYLGKIISLFARRVTYIIFFAASISFIGFESSSNFPTIGKVFVNGMKGYRSNYWQLLFPAILMASLTFSIQFISFGIERAFDPQR